MHFFLYFAQAKQARSHNIWHVKIAHFFLFFYRFNVNENINDNDMQNNKSTTNNVVYCRVDWETVVESY